MNFIEKITGTMRKPKNAMNSIAEQPMIEEAVMIVGIYAVISAVSALVMSDKITYVFEGVENMPSSMQSITAIIGVVGALIGAFLIWVVGTGIIHLISMALVLSQ
ncbi:MAG: YIP1 family protein [Candidatus Methanoperedens sp.]|nr:YIP1 family protein [Candidatus Methanoperedens sp.]